jgi:hypothetical protein
MTSVTSTQTKLSPRARKALLGVHLVTAVGLVGVAVALAVLGVAGLTGAEAHTVYPAMHRIAQVALVPLGLLALAVGVAQSLLGGYGLVRHRWVTAKLLILAVLMVAALAVAVPGLGRAADAALTPGADVAIAQQITATATPLMALVLFGVATYLGAFKPGTSRRD